MVVTLKFSRFAGYREEKVSGLSFVFRETKYGTPSAIVHECSVAMGTELVQRLRLPKLDLDKNRSSNHRLSTRFAVVAMATLAILPPRDALRQMI
ncbi:hypothetical protein NL676_018629 [Syzygium grande]|nr:hypothetical protein NL676_018629 [Syzygium grande]